MQRLELKVSIREAAGKGPARRLRARGEVPAVLYGAGTGSMALAIEGQTLERVLRTGANALIDLEGADPVRGKLVLVKEVQRDPVSRKLIHCDLYAVDPSKRIHVSIPVHIEGRPPGVEEGGVLNTLAREIEVSCLPLAIPDRVVVDVSGLGIGGTVRLSDIVLPEGAEPLAEGTLGLVTVTAPRLEAVPEEEAEAAAAEAGEAAEGAEQKPEGEGKQETGD